MEASSGRTFMSIRKVGPKGLASLPLRLSMMLRMPSNNSMGTTGRVGSWRSEKIVMPILWVDQDLVDVGASVVVSVVEEALPLVEASVDVEDLGADMAEAEVDLVVDMVVLPQCQVGQAPTATAWPRPTLRIPLPILRPLEAREAQPSTCATYVRHPFRPPDKLTVFSFRGPPAMKISSNCSPPSARLNEQRSSTSQTVGPEALAWSSSTLPIMQKRRLVRPHRYRAKQPGCANQPHSQVYWLPVRRTSSWPYLCQICQRWRRRHRRCRTKRGHDAGSDDVSNASRRHGNFFQETAESWSLWSTFPAQGCFSLFSVNRTDIEH